MKSTVQTISILAGVAVAITARFTGKLILIWPAMLLLVIGVSLKNMRERR